jgi:uncharacterized membrane protein
VDKELVIVVPGEAAAHEVVMALEGLDAQGLVELYSSTIVVKDASGTLAVKHTRDLGGTWATPLGLSTGALLGLLGGLIGAFAGAEDLGSDLAYSGFALDFVHDVAQSLKPGSYAVCASLWEDWTGPVDDSTEPFGAVVFRQAPDEVAVAQTRTQWQVAREELAHLEAEIERAAGDQKAMLEARRGDLRAKQEELREYLLGRGAKLQEIWGARIASIEAKLPTAKAEARARHEQHAAKLSRFAAAQLAAFHDLFLS